MNLLKLNKIERDFTHNSHQKDSSLMIHCPECHETVITDNYTGDSICESCGLVISEKALDISNFEKRMFSYEEIRDRARTGISDIIFTPKSSSNTIINKKEINDRNFKRIAKLDTHDNDSMIRNLMIAIRTLKIISGKLKLSYQVKSHALLIYRKALKKGLIKGRTIDGMICACIYFACRTFKKPITLQEIINEACMKGNVVRYSIKVLIKELNLKVIPLGPEFFISRYINELKLSSDVEIEFLFILQYLKQFIAGKNPKVICAGLIYLICKKNLINQTQKEICKTIGVSEVSLRYIRKQIEAYLLERQINVKLDS